MYWQGVLITVFRCLQALAAPCLAFSLWVRIRVFRLSRSSHVCMFVRVGALCTGLERRSYTPECHGYTSLHVHVDVDVGDEFEIEVEVEVAALTRAVHRIVQLLVSLFVSAYLCALVFAYLCAYLPGRTPGSS